MRTRRRLSLIVAVVAALTAAPALSAQSADEQSIRATIAEYFRGHATADSAVMRRPFLPTAHIEGVRQGTFTSWTLDQYVGGFRGVPAADEARRSRRVDDVRVIGTAAMAQATLDHVGAVFTDFFVLLKVNGEWKIANKVYHAAPRTP